MHLLHVCLPLLHAAPLPLHLPACSRLATLNASAVGAAERWDAEVNYLRLVGDELATAGGGDESAAAAAAVLAAHPRYAALTQVRRGRPEVGCTHRFPPNTHVPALPAPRCRNTASWRRQRPAPPPAAHWPAAWRSSPSATAARRSIRSFPVRPASAGALLLLAERRSQLWLALLCCCGFPTDPVPFAMASAATVRRRRYCCCCRCCRSDHDGRQAEAAAGAPAAGEGGPAGAAAGAAARQRLAGGGGCW